MGKTEYVHGEGHRRFEQTISLRTARGVHTLLNDLHVFRERRFLDADYTACDILIDLMSAIKQAKLTKRQRNALYLVYERELSLEETARVMGTNRGNVHKFLWGVGAYKGALERIADVYREWNYEEITISEKAANEALEMLRGRENGTV